MALIRLSMRGGARRLVLAWAIFGSVSGFSADDADHYDPYSAVGEASGKGGNPEAVVPPQCYTRTDGISNPCWTCHTARNGRNLMDDYHLQERYGFSEIGKQNHWTNLFDGTRAEAAKKISDQEIINYIRQDNYRPLLKAIRQQAGAKGWVPDFDLVAGVDADGFAIDGSGWRAFRYKPFPGTFWPTNGSIDDIYIRLPEAFRTAADGTASQAIYRVNLAIVEAAMSQDDRLADHELVRSVESVDERLVDVDLDGDGKLTGNVVWIKGLPKQYVGAAATVDVRRYDYPAGTEFLHTLRYLDPDAASWMSPRLKELRYATKRLSLPDRALTIAYDEEQREKEAGALPRFAGSPRMGLFNSHGWMLQAYIEDAQGRLRLQSRQEHLYCMGCHSTIGVTADQTFGFPRKLPGADGWGLQDLAGIPDVPQAGHAMPEYETYMRRVRGGDEFRSNAEMIERFFDSNGNFDEKRMADHYRSGYNDIRDVVLPSRARALDLNKAYRVLVEQQSFVKGRDFVLSDDVHVHRQIDDESSGLLENGNTFKDGRLWLDWSQKLADLEHP